MKYVIVIGFIYILWSYSNIQLNFNHDKKVDLYQQIVNLETIYNDKLLKSYGIDPDDLTLVCEASDNPNCQKGYIMEKTNMTEKEYNDTFNHPLSQFVDLKEHKLTELQETYNDLKSKITELEDIIELIRIEN